VPLQQLSSASRRRSSAKACGRRTR
jgi:hypothetical protein